MGPNSGSRRCGRPNRHTVVNQMLKGPGPEIPLRCKVCNRGFSLKKYLNVHFRIHSKEKKYKCAVCSKSFTQSGQLKTHLLIHSNVKPFKCPACDKRFRHPSRRCKIHELKVVKVDKVEAKKKCTYTDENKDPNKKGASKVSIKPSTSQEPVVDSGLDEESNSANEKNDYYRIPEDMSCLISDDEEPIDLSIRTEPAVDSEQEDENNAAKQDYDDRMMAAKVLFLMSYGYFSKEITTSVQQQLGAF